MTRQRNYQIRHKLAGKCMLCPLPLDPGDETRKPDKNYCAKHRAQHNARMREYYHRKKRLNAKRHHEPVL